MNVTICYMTNRRDCRFEWFHSSLVRQMGGKRVGKLVVVDFYADERPQERKALADVWVTPKPTVWQGKHRLTSCNYFAPSNARNTGLCFAEGTHVVFVDDLSVLRPKWWDVVSREVRENRKRVVLGRYSKVLNLAVSAEGEIEGYDTWPTGEDSRYDARHGEGERQVSGGWMYGASVCAPIEAMLEINGFDEDCDSMGGEDYAAGIMLEHRGWEIVYHQGMATYEDEMLHHAETPFKHIIKHRGPGSTFTERDASLHYLNLVKYRGRDRAPNYCNLAALREHMLAGGEFPVSRIPEHDWRDGQPLREM